MRLGRESRESTAAIIAPASPRPSGWRDLVDAAPRPAGGTDLDRILHHL